jgi:hypothetical protein
MLTAVFLGWLLGIISTLAVLALAANDHRPVKQRDPLRKHFTNQLHDQLRHH